MKYIITESRLNEFMSNYLKTFFEKKHVVDYVYPYISVLDGDHIGDDEIFEYMEFDRSDGRLWIESGFLKGFSDMFGLDWTGKEASKFITKWFEEKFDVKVEYVESSRNSMK